MSLVIVIVTGWQELARVGAAPAFPRGGRVDCRAESDLERMAAGTGVGHLLAGRWRLVPLGPVHSPHARRLADQHHRNHPYTKCRVAHNSTAATR